MKPETTNDSRFKNNTLEYKDEFGNLVTVTRYNDGRFEKVTQTERKFNFEFLENTYSFSVFDSAETLKVYWDNEHSKRSLIRDKYGRLFHYRYDEEMSFSGLDRLTIVWTLVANDADSDELAGKDGMSLLRLPFVATDETNWMAAQERITSEKIPARFE